MAYTKQTWVATETLLAASRFNHMEDGISGAASDATSALTNSSQNRLMIAPAWVSGRSYTQGDLVTYNGVLKACNTTGTRTEPSDTTNWTTVTISSLYSGLKQYIRAYDTTPTQDSSNPVTSAGIYTALSKKQNSLTFDSTPTRNSTNPVTSGGIYSALLLKQNTLTFDSAPSSSSSNPVTSAGIYTALSKKQNSLTFDTTPKQNSTNPVTSGGVYTSISSLNTSISTINQSLNAKSITVDTENEQLIIVF